MLLSTSLNAFHLTIFYSSLYFTTNSLVAQLILIVYMQLHLVPSGSWPAVGLTHSPSVWEESWLKSQNRVHIPLLRFTTGRPERTEIL